MSWTVSSVQLTIVYTLYLYILLNRTQHVVAVQTVTKAEFRSSQTHEFEAIKKIIPVVETKGNLIASWHEIECPKMSRLHC